LVFMWDIIYIIRAYMSRLKFIMYTIKAAGNKKRGPSGGPF